MPARCAATPGPTPQRLEALLATDPSPSAAALLGSGYLAFTVDQGPEQNRHQGIVTIEGGSLADMALHYFDTSEQLRCMVHLACDQTAAGWRAGALILEKIAGAGGIDPALDDDAQEESWRTATILAATLTDAELLDDDLPPTGCCTGCSIPKASPPTAPAPCHSAAAAPVLGWPASLRGFRSTTWTTWRSTATSS